MIRIFKLASITTLAILVAGTAAGSSAAPLVADYRLNFQVQKMNFPLFRKKMSFALEYRPRTGVEYTPPIFLKRLQGADAVPRLTNVRSPKIEKF